MHGYQSVCKKNRRLYKTVCCLRQGYILPQESAGGFGIHTLGLIGGFVVRIPGHHDRDHDICLNPIRMNEVNQVTARLLPC